MGGVLSFCPGGWGVVSRGGGPGPGVAGFYGSLWSFFPGGWG